MTLKVHHIEFCVKDPKPVVQTLVLYYGFLKIGYRSTPTCTQTVLKSGKTVFLITARNPTSFAPPCDLSEPFTYFCCSNNPEGHVTDSAFNISIQVDNLEKTLSELEENLGQRKPKLLRPINEIHDSQGTVKYCVIKSICGNLVHTLIEKANYDGWFLPEFVQNEEHDGISNVTYSTTHLDHLAFACREGETDKIIQWYTTGFGMKRFMSNRMESEQNGLEIAGDVGMRLKVMEFWKCAELGICSGDAGNDDSMKIVIAESLPNIKNCQIEGYLKNHGTSGLQHVGLYSPNMLDTVAKMAEAGAEFRHPPPTYYTEIGQLEAIQSVNENVEMLMKLGILLDTEADPEDTHNENEHKYLMQIFTTSLFTNDTFILEIIQRKGANGFGVGNISALTRSIIAFNQLQQNMNNVDPETKVSNEEKLNKNTGRQATA